MFDYDVGRVRAWIERKLELWVQNMGGLSIPPGINDEALARNIADYRRVLGFIDGETVGQLLSEVDPQGLAAFAQHNHSDQALVGWLFRAKAESLALLGATDAAERHVLALGALDEVVGTANSVPGDAYRLAVDVRDRYLVEHTDGALQSLSKMALRIKMAADTAIRAGNWKGYFAGGAAAVAVIAGGYLAAGMMGQPMDRSFT